MLVGRRGLRCKPFVYVGAFSTEQISVAESGVRAGIHGTMIFVVQAIGNLGTHGQFRFPRQSSRDVFSFYSFSHSDLIPPLRKIMELVRGTGGKASVASGFVIPVGVRSGVNDGLFLFLFSLLELN